MRIAGLVKTSLIDYPGKVAAVVFTQGCNFRCGFCHNPDLLEMREGVLTEEDIFTFLETRKGRLDGVVITGGEPLVQPDIASFVKKIKTLGYLVKLDTNGSNPQELEDLLDKNLIDYVAMDIKGPLSKYAQICAYPNTKVIQRSVDIIKKSGVEYEFRTTVLPHFHEVNDFDSVGRLIAGAKIYTIQGFRPQITLDPSLGEEVPFAFSQLKEIAAIMAPYVEKVVIHDNL